MSGYNGKSKFRARANFAHAMAKVVRESNVRLLTIGDIDAALSATVAIKGLEAAIEENIPQMVEYLTTGKSHLGRGVLTNKMVVARVNDKYLADMNPSTWEIPIKDDDAALTYTPGWGLASRNAGIYIVKSVKFKMTEEGRRLARANHFVTEMAEEGHKLAQQRMHDLLLAENIFTVKQLDKVEADALAKLVA